MKPALDRILVPIDFGPASLAALDYAIELAQKFGSKVTLVHAYSIPVTEYGEMIQRPIGEMESQAKTALDELLGRTRAKYANVEGEVVFGETARQILDMVEARRCGLVVMGTHGRRGLTRVLLGSVAERIVRTSPVPVLTVSAPKES